MSKTILYVEDNEFNLKIVRQLLSRTSYRLIEAMDGESGVTTAQSELPDLILMDVQLPKLSGLDATRQLRSDVKTAVRIQLFAAWRYGKKRIADRMNRHSGLLFHIGVTAGRLN